MKIGYTDGNICECGEPETVEHVLNKCPLLQPLRRKLRDNNGEKCNSLSLMLGGRPRSQSISNSSSKEDWKITSTELNAVLDFEESG